MSSSRPYRVKIRESVQETVIADDSVTSKLDLVPILPAGEMEGISRTILREHGFEDEGGSEGGGRMSRERDGIRVSIDPSSGGVEARAEQSTEVDISEEGEEEGSGGGCPCRVRSKESISESMRKRLAKKAAGIRQGVQEMVTGRLAGGLADLGCEMEQIANQITGRALKRKASEIGTIKRIQHDDATGGMTIVVEV